MPEPHEETDILQFRSPNQPNLHLVYWTRAPLSDKTSPCLLLINHGFGEHSGRFKKLVAALLDSVPSLDAIISYDMRCHGLSEGDRGATKALDDYINDLCEHVLPRVSLRYGSDAKVVILGHSLGGAIVAGCAARPDCLVAEGCGSIKGIILSAPAMQPFVKGFVNRMLEPFAGFLVKIPGVRGLTRASGIEASDLCRDKKVVEDYENDELTYDLLSVGVATDLLTHNSKVIAKIDEDDSIVFNNVPTLVLHGTKDELVKIDGARRLVAAMQEKGKASVKMVEVEGAYHEIHNEPPEMGSKLFVDTVSEYLTSIYTA